MTMKKMKEREEATETVIPEVNQGLINNQHSDTRFYLPIQKHTQAQYLQSCVITIDVVRGKNKTEV